MTILTAMDDKEQWLHNKLGDSQVSTIIMGQSPSSSAYNEEGIGIPFLQGCAEFGEVFPNTTVFSTDLLKIAPENSILMSVRAPVGTINKADQKYVIGRGLCSIVPVIDGDFLYYYLLQNTHELELKAQGSTFLAINSSELNELPIFYPASLSAQRRIAAILSSADKVIASTQKVIAKYKQMKQGMMEDLLKPREGWKMVRLGECLKQKPDYGINAPAVPYDNNLPTYLRITDITEDGYYSKKDIVSVSSQDALKYVMDEGDLVFARTGASTGKTYLYNPQDGMLVFAGFLIRVRTDENKLLPEFFKYQTQTPQYKNWIAANSMRTGQPGINGNEYEEFSVPIPYKNDKPDLVEQRRIAAILSGIDAKIAAEEKVLEKYEKVKKGLMERLLNEKNE